MKRTKIFSAFLSFLFSVSVWSGNVQTPEPVFYWSFDEVSGETAYDSAGSSDGILKGAGWTTGMVGGAVRLDGQNDYIKLANNSFDILGESFTICSWVYRDSLGPNRQDTIIGYGDKESISNYLSYSIYKDKLLYYVRLSGDSGDDCYYVGTSLIEAGKWYHLALVVNGNQATTYINGSAEVFQKLDESECPGTYGFVNIAQMAETACIGSLMRADGFLHHFHGKIDELAVYDKALSSSEIASTCNQISPLLSRWKFDEGTGDTAYDSTGQYNGTVHGADRIEGYRGGALNFDGYEDYVEISKSNAFDIKYEVTLTAWIKIEGKTRWPRIIAKGGEYDYESPYGIMLDENSQYLVGYLGDGISWNEHLYTEERLAWGKWYHVAMSYSKTAQIMKLYLNGEEVLSTKETADLITTDTPLSIGGLKYRGNWSNFFVGSIDEVRIYNRQLSPEEIFEIWQEENYRTYHVDVESGNDDNDGMSHENAFEKIQTAIDTAENGDIVLVWPGIYLEQIDFKGKTVTVCSAADAATLIGLWDDAVTMQTGEGSGSTLKNFVIANSRTGVAVSNNSSPTLINLTIVSNDFGISADNSSNPIVTSCILWDNSGGDLLGCDASYSWYLEDAVALDRPGGGVPNQTPGFANPDGGDYHLLSKRGRYWPDHGVWVLDEVTSPCVDAGDPDSDFSKERIPNGGRINIGAYGGTPYASMSEKPALLGDLNSDGVVNMLDFAIMGMNWLATE